MPPITVVSPSRTNTSVRASRRLIEGWPFEPVSCGFGWLLVALIFIWIDPSCVTCGVTRSSRRASMKEVVTPAALVCENGMLTPWLMLASTLSTVTTRGELMVLMVPLFSAAERRRFRLAAPPALPKTKPRPPPLLRPMGAGMLTAKLGVLTPVRPETGAAGAAAGPAAPPGPGGHRPVGGPLRRGLLLRPERLDGSDADGVAHVLGAQGLWLEHDVERLVPGDVAQLDGDAALHVIGDDDVLLADLGDGAEQVLDVDVLDVEVDLAARVVGGVEHVGLARSRPGVGRHGRGPGGRRGGLRHRLRSAELPDQRALLG